MKNFANFWLIHFIDTHINRKTSYHSVYPASVFPKIFVCVYVCVNMIYNFHIHKLLQLLFFFTNFYIFFERRKKNFDNNFHFIRTPFHCCYYTYSCTGWVSCLLSCKLLMFLLYFFSSHLIIFVVLFFSGCCW